MGYHIGYNYKISDLEDENKELKSKIAQLEKTLCPECKKKFEKIFKET